MTSIKLKFRASADAEKPGTLYYQIIHNRVVRQLKTSYLIYLEEWDPITQSVRTAQRVHAPARREQLQLIQDRINWEIRTMQHLIHTGEQREQTYTTDDLTKAFRQRNGDLVSVFEFMRRQTLRLQQLGRIRSSDNCRATMNSFRRFRKNEDLSFDRIDKELMEDYEAFLKASGLKRNTSSFYMRNLRTIYNQAVERGLTQQKEPFKRVYTGIDKTIKRALTLGDIRKIKELDLTENPKLDFARDMFMMSFYMRGMSFIDMAYLRKRDLQHGILTYCRRKTGKELTLEWEWQMQRTLEKYPANRTSYLLPIINHEDGTERTQYLNRMSTINHLLKRIGETINCPFPLSMYAARHSWASIAREKRIALPVISEGLGHDSETTTQIYLAAIQTSAVDHANKKILQGL